MNQSIGVKEGKRSRGIIRGLPLIDVEVAEEPIAGVR
jgi:hypothetical protein